MSRWSNLKALPLFRRVLCFVGLHDWMPQFNCGGQPSLLCECRFCRTKQ